MSSFKLHNSKTLGDYEKPYIVAEINTSHFGDLSTAFSIIDAAKDCGVDCVKFQSWTAETLYCPEYYSTNSIARRVIKKFSLSEPELLSISDYCKSSSIDFASTPYSIEEAQFLISDCDVPFIKIASMELTNLKFLRELATLNYPLVLSTGMGDQDEILCAANLIKEYHSNFSILHCNSLYPTPESQTNLLNILGLRKLVKEQPIGFSDHTVGISVPIASAALGICILEKHFTLDNSKIGMDNQMATEPAEFKRMVNSIHSVHQSLGSHHRQISEEEKSQRFKMRRSAVTVSDLCAGHVLAMDDVCFMRPGDGIPPNEIELFVGRKLVCDVSKGYVLKNNHFSC